MLRTEFDYLIHLIGCELNKKQAQDIPQDLSWQKVFDIASEHEITPLAYLAVRKLENKPDISVFRQFENKYYLSFSRNSKQMSARKTIADALHAKGIYTIEVQGTKVKKYYPAENLRLMSDIDFIIPTDKIPEAEELMRSLGYEVKNATGREVHASSEQIFIELHTDFFDKDNMIYPVLNGPFGYAELKEDFTAEVSQTVFYLFNLLHALKHYHYSGLGISRIIDIYILKKALGESVDGAYIDKLLTKHGLKGDMDKLYALAAYWFDGVEPEIDISALETEVFEAHRHGTSEIKLKRELEHDRAKGRKFVKLRHSLSLIFAPKKDIYDAYPNLKKHKIPLALCWIYRMFSILFSKEKTEKFKKYIRRLIKSE